MINEYASLLHHLFEIAQTQRVGDVPAHAQQHDVQRKSQPLDHASDAFHDRRCVRYERQINRSDVMKGLQKLFASFTRPSVTTALNVLSQQNPLRRPGDGTRTRCPDS
jgi:hypothetical protein